MQASDTVEQPNRIQVVVRVRPVLPHELADEVAVTCSPDARKLQVLLPDRLAGGANLLPGATRSGARAYEFDACLPGNTTQEELYETCGLQELVDAALDGYCVTVFAFGQTGSGKTHTIIGPKLSRGAAAAAAAAAAAGGGGGGGSASSAATTGRLAFVGDDLLPPQPPGSASSARSAASAAASGCSSGGGVMLESEDGILTRCIAAAYRSIEARSGSAEFTVTASVVELYNEAVTDLLALDKTKQLQVRKDARDGFAVVGLTQVSCPTDVSALRYMVRALQYRHTRGHRLNEYSSRSHCLMTFVFSSTETGPGGQMGAKGGVRRYGKLALVDLAGSERLKDTGNSEKGAVRETGAINKSLFTLGQVLATLSARSCGNPNAFVPFRDSKLTQLLWDGLRGSGRCLMLACLSPMRSAADESLNTLHFSTMATRIKAEPVVLLDPQDQLVLDLRKTISQLREENRQLAGALQQLSLGIDASSVLATLPEALRAHAGGGGSGGGSAAGSGTASPTPPDQPGSPSTPQRQLQLQPSPSTGGRGRQPFESAVAEAAAAVSGSGNGTASYIPPLPPPQLQPLQQQPQQTPLLQNSTVGALRTSYGSVHGSMLLYQQSQQPASYQSSYPQSQQRSAAMADMPSPSQSSPVPVGGNRVRGKQNGRPYPAQSAYGVLDGPGRNGRKPAAPGAKSSPPRSRSVGRSGGRPTYLTEDPAALLFGYSSALQPPPPLPPPGSGSSSTVSLPALVPTRGPPGVPPPPPPPTISEFPELAAMEAEFQSILANGGGGGSAATAAAAALQPPPKRAPPRSAPGPSAGSGGAAAPAAVEDEAEDSGGPRPDVRALKWAERNAWFGTDYDMTSYAYQVHDRLVDGENVDPTSDLYYMEIERRVAEKFPDRWARAMKDQLPGGSGAAAVAAVRRAAPSPNRPRPADPPRSSPPPSYSAALRVNLKDPLASVRSGSGYSPGVAASGASREIAASLAAQAAAARARHAPPAAQQQQQQAAQVSASFDSASYELCGGTSPLDGGSEPSTPPMMGGVNPFNIEALHAVAPPKASRMTHVPGAGQGLMLMPAGLEPLGARNPTAMEIMADPNAAERIQKEYARQRALVVEELRKAKEDAEAERQRILARIQRAAGGNKWR